MKEYNKTKILATIGPQTSTTEKIKQLVNAGVDAVRLNMSHGDHDFYSSVFENIHTARTDLNLPLAVLADLQGPKIRVGKLEGGEPVRLKRNALFSITSRPITGTVDMVSTTYPNLVQDVKTDDTILLDDGLIRLQVLSVDRDTINSDLYEKRRRDQPVLVSPVASDPPAVVDAGLDPVAVDRESLHRIEDERIEPHRPPPGEITRGKQ